MKRKQIFTGAFINYLVIAVQMLSMVIITPFLISRLGDGAYGVYRIVFSIVAYMGILNFGFGNATVRFLTEIRAKNDPNREQEFLSIVKMLNLAAVIIAIAVGLVTYAIIPHAFSQSLTVSEINIAQQMFIILTISIVINILNDIYSAIVTSHERFIYLRGLDFVRVILRVSLIVCVLMLHPSAVYLVLIDLLLSVLVFCINIAYCNITLGTKPKYSIKVLKGIDREFYKPVIIYSALFFINLIVVQLIDNTSPIIIGMRLSSFDAAVYGAALTLSSGFWSFSLVISTIIFPTIVKTVSAGASKDELTDIMTRISRVQALLSMLVVSVFFAFGRQFVDLWVGSSYEAVWMISTIIMFGTLLNSLTSTGHLILRAVNKQGFILSAYIAVFILNAGITFVIIPVYGIIGAAVCTFMSYAVVISCFLLPYLHKSVGISISRFIKSMILPVCVPIPFMILSYLLFNHIQLNNWINLTLGVAGYICIYGLIVYSFVINKEERSFAIGMFLKIAKKNVS